MRLFSHRFHPTSSGIRHEKKNANREKRFAKPRLGFETLELRTLLSASPATNVFVDDVETANDAEIAFETTGAEVDVYNIDYRLFESGNVQYPSQNGLRDFSSATYCAVPDKIYIELWNEAIARWEDVLTEGVADVVYEGVEIDDLYLYFGFSSSFLSSNLLGQTIDGGFRRDGGTGLAATGSLYFNSKYFIAYPSDRLQTIFFNAALHEIGHALGYNLTTFKMNGLVASTQEAALGLNDVFATATTYYYVGTNGVARYRETFPDALTTLSTNAANELNVSDAVLMETYSSSGTFGTHVSSIYGTYFNFIYQRDGMTYSISSAFDGTISARTLGILEDLGYSVNYDFADPCASPAPVDLTANALGTTVRLNWASSDGDFSDSKSTTTTYSVERLDLSDANAVWTTLASGISTTNYVDSTVEANATFRYRVVANNVKTFKSVGVYNAAPGESFSWSDVSNGLKFSVYALQADGSNGASWLKVGATSSPTWTSSQINATLFRVVDESALDETSEPSRAVEVSIAADADNFIPSGFCADDWNALKTFLETTDSQGIKNGTKIDPQYAFGLLDILDGIVWETVDEEKRVVSLSWTNLGLVGTLDLSACDELQRVAVSGNELTAFASESLKLTILDISSNSLTTLDLTKTTALESLNCSENQLTTLNLSNNVALIYLNVSDVNISELFLETATSLTTLRAERIFAKKLDLSANERLTSAFLGSETIAEIVLCKQFTGTIDLSGALDEPTKTIVWTRDAATLSVESALTFDGQRAVATVGTGESTRQIMVNVVSDNATPDAPNDLSFEITATNCLEISWNVSNDGATGYKISYRVRSTGPWKALADLSTSTATPNATGNEDVLSVSTKVLSNRVYTFRILAYSFDANGSVLYSEPFEKTFDPRAVEKSVALTLSSETIFVGVPIAVTASCDNVEIETSGAVFQWFRVDESGNETQISGASDSTYSPVAADFGFRLKVVAKFFNSNQTATAISSRAVVLGPPELDAFFDEGVSDDDWFFESFFGK